MKIDIQADVVRTTEPRIVGKSAKKLVGLHISYMDGDYEQIMQLDCWQMMADKAQTLAQGDTVRCNCYLGGNEFKREDGSLLVFNKLRCVSIDIISRAVDLNASGEVSLKSQIVTKAKQQNTEADDLPF
jgi:hypothetical protein